MDLIVQAVGSRGKFSTFCWVLLELAKGSMHSSAEGGKDDEWPCLIFPTPGAVGWHLLSREKNKVKYTGVPQVCGCGTHPALCHSAPATLTHLWGVHTSAATPTHTGGGIELNIIAEGCLWVFAELELRV